MYDNVLFQNASRLLEDDIKNSRLPGAILFSGNPATGKLTTALETARVLSCSGKVKGAWTCSCPSCLQHKALVSQNIIVTGPRDCSLEIAASLKAFLNSAYNNDSHLSATRYLFVRSIRKLTMRFNGILWQGNEKQAKIAAMVKDIEELLEEIDAPRQIPENEELEKITAKLLELTTKLEEDFSFDSVPILHIRNISSWAHVGAADGTKVIIIEHAERMLEGVRNALLKILEEPPKNTVFILTTTRRSAVMPTILSRVRTYTFNERTSGETSSLIERVYHESFDRTIEEYLEKFLPVSTEEIERLAKNFFIETTAGGRLPDINALVKDAKKFEPRLVLKIFLQKLSDSLKRTWTSQCGSEASFECNKYINGCYSDVTIKNQNVTSALENLMRNIAFVNKMYGGVFKESI